MLTSSSPPPTHTLACIHTGKCKHTHMYLHIHTHTCVTDSPPHTKKNGQWVEELLYKFSGLLVLEKEPQAL